MKHLLAYLFMASALPAMSFTPLNSQSPQPQPQTQKQNMEANKVIEVVQLDFKVDECTAEVYLNGIPIRRYKAELKFSSVPALANLVEGENTLELLVNPGPTPNTARKDAEIVVDKPRKQPSGFAEAKVVIYPEGVYPGDPSGKILAAVSLDAPVLPNAKPRLTKITFNLSRKDAPNLRRWAWQDAEKIDLRKDEAAIMETVNEAWECMRTGKYSQKLFELQYTQDMEAHYEFPALPKPEDERPQKEEVYRERAEKKDWLMFPLLKPCFDFRLCADGRLVEIIDKDWQASVRTVPLKDYGMNGKPGPYDYPMLLGKIKGKFHILR